MTGKKPHQYGAGKGLRRMRTTSRLRTYLILLALLAVQIGPSVVRAEEITLEKALEVFYTNNYDIIISRYETDKAQADLITARLFPNPNASVNYAGFSSGFNRTDTTQQIYRLDQLIELGGKRGYRIKTAQETMEAVKLTHKDAVRNLLAGFYTTYHMLLLGQLNLDFVQGELSRFDRVVNIGEKRHTAGFLSLIDFTKLRLARVDLENNVTTASTQYRNDLENLCLILGGIEGVSPSRGQVKEEFPPFEETALLDTAYATRWDLLSLERHIRAADYGTRLARSQRIPDIVVGGEYEGYGRKLEPGRGAGVSVNIPIFARNQGEIMKRTAEHNQLKIQVERLKKQIQTEVRQALNNYRSGITIFDSYRTRKVEMEELLSRSEKAFSLGGITVLELLDTYKTYRDFMMKYNQALIQSALNKELIRVATGEIK